MIKDHSVVLPIEHIKGLMHQLASGGDYMHSRLVLHRDIKGDNLLLDTNYVLKIADFGLATQLASPEELVHSFCGTPKYQAPELLIGCGYGLGVDVWAAGCTVYRLYYGHPPFEALGVKELQHAIMYKNVKYSRASRDDLPIKNEDIQLLRALLCKDPNKRLTFKQLLEKKKYFQEAQPLDINKMKLCNSINLANDETSLLKNMITTLKRLTQTCKVNKRLRVNYLNENHETLKPAHWIVQWVAGEYLFGQGYRTNTNIFGCNFKDASKMLLLNDKEFVFWPPNENIKLYKRNECPKKLQTKLNIITQLKIKSASTALIDKENIDKTTEEEMLIKNVHKLPWLIGYVQTEKAFVFHLSNAIFQLMYPAKIILFDGIHRSMTIINTRKNISLTLSLDYIQSQKYITKLLHNYIYVPCCYIKLLDNW